MPAISACGHTFSRAWPAPTAVHKESVILLHPSAANKKSLTKTLTSSKPTDR